MEIIRRKKDNTISGYREKVYIHGKSITKTFKRKTDAKDWKRNIELERDKHSALGLSVNLTITFKEFVELWIDRKNDQSRSQRTIESYYGVINNYFSPINKKRLRNLNINDGYNVLKEASKRPIGTTRKNFVLRILKQILNDAVRWDYITKNPLKHLSYAKVSQKQSQYWVPLEIDRFLQSNTDNPLYELFLVALNTGMRRGELLGLCWDRVDLEYQRIDITRIKDRYGLKETTKTGINRTVPMNALVFQTLQQMHNEKQHPSFVFTMPDGEPINVRHISDRHFKGAIEKAGVKKITFHNLRSTYASNFCMQGGDIYSLSKILGHTSVDMTTKRYAHLHPHYLQEAARGVELGYLKKSSPHLAHTHFEVVKKVNNIGVL